MNKLIEIDSENRTRALDLASFIVEAPAGAGKTELLTQRYLKLLATVESPEEIVALTFTNKAANEMRNRILQSLESAQNNTKIDAPHKQITRDLANAALQHAQHLGWQLLAQPARLRILTMDALCSSLARQMPLLSRFGGQPNISDDAKSHYLTAAQQTLAAIQTESNLSDTVSTALRYMHNDIEKLTDLLADMLSKRDQWLPLVGEHAGITVDEITQQVSVALNALIKQRLQLAIETGSAQWQTQLMPVARFAANNIEDANHACKALLDWQTPLSSQPDDLTQWQALGDFLLTDAGTFRKKLDKNIGLPAKDKNQPQNEAYKQQFIALTALIVNPQALHAARSLPNVSMHDISANSVIVKALAQLLQLATAELWASFQAANEVDFVQIAQSASYALQNELGTTDLALKLDYKISHLLIDEFQDTSPTQMRLIEQLIQGWQPNDNRTLFCVGDPMQSIYRFRKADVSLFLAAAEFGIGQLPLQALKLSRNNRSHPAIVGWINQTFQTIFPAIDDKAQAAIQYRPFIATKPNIDDEGIQTHALVVNNDEEGDAAKLLEARYVADLIKQEQTKNPNQSIAVLVRSRSHLRELVSVIRREYAQMHFQAVEIEGLNDRQTVLDAYSLCRALLHRADRVHWLNILRAPWCGLVLADLHALASSNRQLNIWQLMQDETLLQKLSINGQQRLAHVKNILQPAFEAQGRMPLRRWLESTWLKLGGGNTLISAGDNRDIQAFFDLVDKLARGMVLDFAQLDAAMLNLYAEPDIDATPQLQFLTIHKSKGLEFDCVILPALNRPPRNKDAPLMLWEEVPIGKKLELLAAPFTKTTQANKPTIYDFLKSLETQRADNETTRLLYVAATRAVRKLHLVGTVRPSKSNELKPKAKSLLALLWPHVEADFLQATVLQTILKTSENTQLSLASFSPKLMRLSKLQVPELLNVEPLLATGSEKYNQQTQANQQLVSEAKNLNASAVPINQNALRITHNICQDAGSLAHLYMALIANAGVATWPASRINACSQGMHLWLLQKGHSETEAKAQVTNIINALLQTISSPQGLWILAPRASRMSELALSNVNENTFAQHRIDLTFTDNDVRWIIDYKLNTQIETADLNQPMLISQLAQQHQPQLARYASLFKDEGLPIKTAVFFLSLGELVEI